MVLVGEDKAEPARCGAGEGLTAAQKHLVSEETPPQRQLALKRRLSDVLHKDGELEVKHNAHKNCTFNVFTKVFSFQLMLYTSHSGKVLNWGTLVFFSVILWTLGLSNFTKYILN